MKFIKLALIAVAVAIAPSVHAVVFTTATAFGKIDPGAPADLDKEAGYINWILGMSNAGPFPTTDTEDLPGPNDRDYTKYSSTAGYAAATDTGAVKKNSNDAGFSPASIDITGFTYLLAKFGNTSFVWYLVGITGPVDISGIGGTAMGLSHYSLFNPTTTNVPDAASTLALLALGLASLGLIARRRKA